MKGETSKGCGKEREKTSAKICRYILSPDIIVHNSYNYIYIIKFV